MSAFFLAINRKQTAFSQELAERMMRQLDRFGDDGKKVIVQDHFALGYQCHYSVPEEVGEQQPLVSDDGSFFMFHGRVDNRDELSEALSLQVDSVISDAALVRRYLDTFGEATIEKIIGPFVFVKFNAKTNTVLLARDAMGARYLVYRITPEHILVATYEMALVAHGSFGYNINREKAARYLLNEMENVPSSLIEGLEPLNPGMSLKVEQDELKLNRYYRYSPKRRIKFDSDSQYAAEFRRLLDQAVRRRMRSNAGVGTMLSGGMDSVPMTILAKQESERSNKGLTAFSWVFDKYPKLDERKYSSPVCRANNIEQVMINCDDLWPQFDATTDLNPIIPFGIPFSEYQEETLRLAKSSNTTTLLTGIHGDLLYEHTHTFFYELIKRGRFKRAIDELLARWSSRSSKWQFIKLYILRPLGLVQKVAAWRHRNRQFESDIVTEQVARKIKQREHWLKDESQTAIRPQQWQVMLDGFAGDDAVHGRYLDAKHGVERRYPFRDRDLCEFMLAIPSEQLYFNLSARPIVKHAFENEFTKELLSRNDKTNFSEAIYAGIKTDKIGLAWFHSEHQDWRQYVKQCYFSGENGEKTGNQVVRWRCGYYDYWKSTCYTPTKIQLGVNNEAKNKNYV